MIEHEHSAGQHAAQGERSGEPGLTGTGDAAQAGKAGREQQQLRHRSAKARAESGGRDERHCDQGREHRSARGDGGVMPGKRAHHRKAAIRCQVAPPSLVAYKNEVPADALTRAQAFSESSAEVASHWSAPGRPPCTGGSDSLLVCCGIW